MVTSRERARLALNHEEPDRIPNDLAGTIVSSIHKEAYVELTDYLDIEPGEMKMMDDVQQLPEVSDEFRDYFQVDFLQLAGNSPGDWELEIEEREDSYVYYDEWGTLMKMPKNGGHYFDYYEFPLTGDIEELQRYDWPDPDDPARTEGLRERAEKMVDAGYAVCGSPLFGGGILEQSERIIGLAEFFTLLLKDPAAAEYTLERLTDIYNRAIENFLEEVGDLVDVILYWDDVGSQDSLLVSPETYR